MTLKKGTPDRDLDILARKQLVLLAGTLLVADIIRPSFIGFLVKIYPYFYEADGLSLTEMAEIYGCSVVNARRYAIGLQESNILERPEHQSWVLNYKFVNSLIRM